MKRLFDDCYSGQVDLIITKSVSRFSQNIVKVIDIVKALTDMKVSVDIYFEVEGWNTFENSDPILLSLLKAIAMEESERKHEQMPFVQYESHLS